MWEFSKSCCEVLGAASKAEEGLLPRIIWIATGGYEARATLSYLSHLRQAAILEIEKKATCFEYAVNVHWHFLWTYIWLAIGLDFTRNQEVDVWVQNKGGVLPNMGNRYPGKSCRLWAITEFLIHIGFHLDVNSPWNWLGWGYLIRPACSFHTNWKKDEKCLCRESLGLASNHSSCCFSDIFCLCSQGKRSDELILRQAKMIMSRSNFYTRTLSSKIVGKIWGTLLIFISTHHVLDLFTDPLLPSL